MNKLWAFLGLISVLLSGCTNTAEPYSTADPAVGCWHVSVWGFEGHLLLNADHTYQDSSPLGATSGKWVRDGEYIQLMKYKPSEEKYVNTSRVLYHAETDALYIDDMSVNRVSCVSIR